MFPDSHLIVSDRCHHFDHANLLRRQFGSHGIDHRSRLEAQQATRVDLDARVRDVLQQRTLGSQQTTEGRTGQRTSDQQLQCTFGHADQTHATAAQSEKIKGNNEYTILFNAGAASIRKVPLRVCAV
jgi:hypothetical protein